MMTGCPTGTYGRNCMLTAHAQETPCVTVKRGRVDVTWAGSEADVNKVTETLRRLLSFREMTSSVTQTDIFQATPKFT